MNKVRRIKELICMAFFVLFLIVCGKTQEQVEPKVSSEEKRPEEKQTEENKTENISGAVVENNDITKENNILEEPDNPYRDLPLEVHSKHWMEVLYEVHKDVPEIEAGEIIYAFDVYVTEDWPYQAYTYKAAIPYFLDAQDDEILQQIQQWYSEQNWILTEEEREEYVALFKDYTENSAIVDPGDSYEFWRAYRQEQFITVIFENRTNWGRLYSWPYADIFLADTGEHVVFEDLFGGKEEELEQVLTESGREIPDGCIMEEWESWKLMSEEIHEVPLPEETDRSFYPTPYGIVFSYTTGEIGPMAAGTILIFVDWGSLEGICESRHFTAGSKSI